MKKKFKYHKRKKRQDSLLSSLLKLCKKNLMSPNSVASSLIVEDQVMSDQIFSAIDKANREKNEDFSLAKEFEKDFDVIVYDGNCKIVTRNLINTRVIPSLKSFKDNETSFAKINVTPFSSGDLFRHIKREPKEIPSGFLETNKFSSHFLSLLILSSEVKNLISKGKLQQAGIIKKDIFFKYKEPGTRFCNCYSRGYVQKYLDFLKGKGEKEIEEKMWELSNMQIFFISNPLIPWRGEREIDKIILRIVKAIEGGSNYIALHSLGGASVIAEKISDEILKKGIDQSYGNIRIDRKNIDGKRDFSYIWYNKDGKNLYDLFKSLWS